MLKLKAHLGLKAKKQSYTIGGWGVNFRLEYKALEQRGECANTERRRKKPAKIAPQ